MAFVIVAIVLFFVIVAIIFFRIQLSDLEKDAMSLRKEKASEIALNLVNAPELFLSGKGSTCDNCIDLDKAFAWKERIANSTAYLILWGKDISHISIEILYPANYTGECTRGNYPRCRTITLLNASSEYELNGGYIAVCRNDLATQRGLVCGLGKLLVSAKGINNAS
jgi:hypothetical protein